MNCGRRWFTGYSTQHQMICIFLLVRYSYIVQPLQYLILQITFTNLIEGKTPCTSISTRLTCSFVMYLHKSNFNFILTFHCITTNFLQAHLHQFYGLKIIKQCPKKGDLINALAVSASISVINRLDISIWHKKDSLCIYRFHCRPTASTPLLTTMSRVWRHSV